MRSRTEPDGCLPVARPHRTLQILCLVLIVSPLGKVRLGGTEATPDYTYTGWFSMLFAAGWASA